MRSGADSDGTLRAWDFLNIGSGAAGIGCPYAIANQRLVFQPAESPLRQGSYRGIGATANHFARESHLDELAHRLGADPVELRLRHLEDERLADVLRAAAERAGWNARPGLGIACGVEKGAYIATCAEVTVDDGTIRVTRLVTAFDCGAIVDSDNLVNQIEGATIMGIGGALFERVGSRRGASSPGRSPSTVCLASATCPRSTSCCSTGPTCPRPGPARRPSSAWRQPSPTPSSPPPVCGSARCRWFPTGYS